MGSCLDSFGRELSKLFFLNGGMLLEVHISDPAVRVGLCLSEGVWTALLGSTHCLKG